MRGLAVAGRSAGPGRAPRWSRRLSTLNSPCATSTRKPSTPRSSQKRRTSSNIAGTSGLRQSRSGWVVSKRWRYHSPSGDPGPGRAAEDRVPVVGRLRAAAALAAAEQVARRAPGCPGPAASAAWNHACSDEVWLGTRSTITLSPRSWAVASRSSASVERAEPRVDVAVVGHVVARVVLRRGVERRDPHARRRRGRAGRAAAR